MNDFVAKPVEPKMLYAALLKWLPARVSKNMTEVKPGNVIAAAMDSSMLGEQKMSASTDLSHLTNMPGMNVERGLAALRGNSEKYLNLFIRFVETNIDAMKKLNSTLNSGDQDGARRLAHTVRGTSATLGADRLAALASDLERLLRESPKGSIRAEDIRIKTDAVNQEFITLAAALPIPPKNSED